jgi:phosphoribosylanthranilate isomerase
VQRVGVFVNAGIEEIGRVRLEVGLNMIQLHGDESPEFCRQTADRLSLPVIKALRVKDERILETVARYDTAYILLEPFVPGRYGGTGRTVDWDLAARIVRAFPQKLFLLAGGLNPENARLASETVKPFALDASSGLESEPGLKSPEKMKAFFEVIHQ